MKMSFIYLFFFLGLKGGLCLAVDLHCVLHYEHFMIPTHFRDQLNKLRRLLTGFSDSQISGAIPYTFSLVFLNGTFSEIYDGWLRTAGN